MRKEYDRDTSDSDYDGTTGGRPGLYAGVTWDFPTLTPESGHTGFDVALHTGTDPTDQTTYVAAIRHVKDASALDAAIRIPSKKTGTATVHASVRAVFKFGPGPWATDGTGSTQSTGTVVVPGVSTVGAYSTTPTADVLSIGGTGNHTVTAHGSDSTTPGVLVPAAQDFPTGNKTFNSDIILKSGGGYKITFSDGTNQTTASTAGISALTGDVTASGSGSVAATIATDAVTTTKILANTVTNAKLAAMPSLTIKGNDGGSSGGPYDLTTSQVSTMLTTGSVSPTLADLVVFGAGGDGSLSSGAGTTQLSRDMYYTNVTLGSGDKIITNGWRLFISGTLDISGADSGAITWAGDAASNATNFLGASGGTGRTPSSGSGTVRGCALDAQRVHWWKRWVLWRIHWFWRDRS